MLEKEIFAYALGLAKELTESVETKNDASKILDVLSKLLELRAEMLMS